MLPRKFWAAIVIVILLDQVSKFFLSDSIGSVITNQGISFGLLASYDKIIVLVIVAALIIVLKSSQQLINQHPVLMGLFVGGGVSNLIDRLLFGAVRDWMPLMFFGLRNNLADWAIAVGVVGVFLLLSRGILIKYRTKSVDHIPEDGESQIN